MESVVRNPALLSCLLLLAACGEVDDSNDSSADTEEVERPSNGRGGETATEPGPGEPDAETPGERPTTPDETGTEDPGSTPERPSPGEPEACSSNNLDGAIACQVEANAAYVDAFCDCYTENGYDGLRGDCEADQPGADAFQPDPCTRMALLEHEAAAVSNSLCYATGATELAACFSACPESEEAFNACYDAVGAAFAECDTRVPAPLSEALQACADGADPGGGGGGGSELGGEIGEAMNGLLNQRSSYVDQYCSCYVGPEFSDASTCRSTVENYWDPGLSSCEQSVFAANPSHAVPFVACIAESFVIARSACAECPSPGMFEYELCADLSIDLNFCFTDAAEPLQDALVGCSG